MSDFSFQRHERLTGADFKRAQRRGRRSAGRALILWAFRRSGAPTRATRLGLVVGRRHGGAVARNLFKRRVREAFRRGKPWPRNWDLVAMPKTPGPFPPAYAIVAAELSDSVEKLTGVRRTQAKEKLEGDREETP